MNEKYLIEIKEFEQNFKEYKNSKIVLYGIGRYTATLVNGLRDFQIIGLMDKDPENIGKLMFGLPIMDIKTVEEKADIVVINTSETYWDVIFKRINEINIPVFFKNGCRAKIQEKIIKNNIYAGISMNDLEKKIKNAEVISFDFYDTLFMRKICNPNEVFNLLSLEIQDLWPGDISYIELRNRAKEHLDNNYTIKELYNKMQDLFEEKIVINWTEIEKKEIELEKKLITPRKVIVDLLKKYIKSKKIYITTDMYLPSIFFQDVLGESGITNYYLLVSSECKKSKIEGNLYDNLINENRNKNILHIGDNKQSDIEMSKERGIDTFFLPSAWDLFKESSLSSLIIKMSSNYHSLILGMIVSEIFNNPFTYEEKDEIEICENEQMGYALYGPVLLTFLLWLQEQSNEERLIFMARDGYFLKEDYELLFETKVDYINISRQIAMTASISAESVEDIIEYMKLPYSGSKKEMMEDRFGGIEIEEQDERLEIEELYKKYKIQIHKYIEWVRINYLKYLKEFNFDSNCSVVDIGYYGNNQKYLNKLLKLKMKGYYFNANLSPENPNIDQEMRACFQNQTDITGQMSEIKNKQIFIESFLTAPHGMIRAIDESGNIICAQESKNQIYFSQKIKINEGVKRFITDFKKIVENNRIIVDPLFIDLLYGVELSGVQFGEQLKNSFYNDNALMNRIESKLFY